MIIAILEYYKEYQKFQDCKEIIFPDRPEEAAMLAVKACQLRDKNQFCVRESIQNWII